MKDALKAIFGWSTIAAPIVGAVLFLARPVGSEPQLNLKAGHTVTLTSVSGDKLICPSPLSTGVITCSMPGKESAVCYEAPDASGIFNDCRQPWKWAWKDNLKEAQSFGLDIKAIEDYEKTHAYHPFPF